VACVDEASRERTTEKAAAADWGPKRPEGVEKTEAADAIKPDFNGKKHRGVVGFTSVVKRALGAQMARLTRGFGKTHKKKKKKNRPTTVRLRIMPEGPKTNNGTKRWSVADKSSG